MIGPIASTGLFGNRVNFLTPRSCAKNCHCLSAALSEPFSCSLYSPFTLAGAKPYTKVSKDIKVVLKLFTTFVFPFGRILLRKESKSLVVSQ